ncbi:MAG: hypothetical protein IJK89_02610 [Clostridia bacterium]|nr:hypothetical protein [Clostridia bacterium]
MATTTLVQTEQADGITFGIRIATDQGQIFTYPEIAERRADTERLVRRLKLSDVSPLHYDDVVRDYILALAFERLRRNGLE